MEHVTAKLPTCRIINHPPAWDAQLGDHFPHTDVLIHFDGVDYATRLSYVLPPTVENCQWQISEFLKRQASYDF